MAKITGRVEVLVNGQLLLHKKGATASGIGISGEPSYELKEIIGESGFHGFIEEPVPAKCEVKLTDRDDVSLDTLARIREDGTVIFRAAGGGKVYTMNGATCTRNFSLSSGEGEVGVTFLGPYWTESTET